MKKLTTDFNKLIEAIGDTCTKIVLRVGDAYGREGVVGKGVGGFKCKVFEQIYQ